MRGFVRRALEKLSKLDTEQIEQLFQTLGEENERLAVVLDSMNDGVFVTDELHRLVLVNKAAERMVPIAPGRIIADRPVWQVIADEDIATFVRETLENDESISDQEFTLDHGGTTRILNCSVIPLVQAGHIRGNILQLVDISEKRGREARLRRAESLASLTTLAAGVAHEIKNPLGSIGIHTQLLQKLVREQSANNLETVESYLGIIEEEIERLNKIVVDFLFAVRPMDTKLEDNDLNLLVEDLLTFVQYELEQAEIELVRDLDPDLAQLHLDPKYFKQAVLNIIKNAISAMPDGGMLRVSTQQRGDQALLRISDNGIGMSDEVRDKIFEPYFTTHDFGSGIGLTLVYKVVKEHMGDISVISKEGHGTTFTITLPVPQRDTHLITWEGREER
ncbi:MAG: ATP-binding protein [Spirochaeta sp.]|jgi:two-component system, sporulation sensor kinase E|nr:ATP-binding protein [Spirochaeta sp.]